MEHHQIVLGYVGPDTLLPVMTALSAVVGVMLIGWGYIVNFFRKVFRLIIRSKD